MSFILDALKKSEAERRKGEVPRLQNEPFSPPPRRRPVWPLLLVLALLLNGAVLGWWLLARNDKSEVAAVTAEPSRLPARTPAAPAASPAASSLPRLTAPAPPAEPEVVTEIIGQPPLRPAALAARPAPVAAAERATPPRAEAPAAAPARPRAAAAAPAAEAYPPISELPGNVRSGLPRLDLQLHFYTPDPARRLVRLNGSNLREGSRSADGLSVVEITQGGVKLAYGGSRFFLPTGRP